MRKPRERTRSPSYRPATSRRGGAGAWVLGFGACLAGFGTAPGCSWLFVQPLHSDYQRTPYRTCTSSQAAPVIDTVLVMTNVVSALYVAGQDNVTNKGSSIGLGLSVATAWALSAAYGYRKTSECEAAQRELIDAAPLAPGPWRRPPLPSQPPGTATPPGAALAPVPAAGATTTPVARPPTQPPPSSPPPSGAPSGVVPPGATAPPPVAAPVRQAKDTEIP